MSRAFCGAGRTAPRTSATAAELADYVRELLLCGHLIDRASMPHIIGAWGIEDMKEMAIEEWRGASPVYTRRMQRLLGFQGTDVATVFKGMQLDIGAPPQFLDFRYKVDDAEHGEFWLDHCGALMDVEPMGDEFVVAMCHDIEDPTFPATACATNPRAKVEPLHRPPRVPADRHPHCHWTCTIDPHGEPAVEPELAIAVAATPAGRVPLAQIDPADDRGRHDYTGRLEDDLDLEAFSPSALAAIADEVALQGHLLSLSGLLHIAALKGEAAAADIGRHQLTGIAGVAARRLAAAGGTGTSLAAAADVLSAHPALLPASYVTLELALDEAAGTLRVALGDCPALHEASGLSWPELLAAGADSGWVEPLDVIVQAVDPRLRCRVATPVDGEVAAWEVWRSDEPADTHPDVVLTSFSTGTDFAFEDRSVPVEIRNRDA